jgi:short subunit fatty acids transporter
MHSNLINPFWMLPLIDILNVHVLLLCWVFAMTM